MDTEELEGGNPRIKRLVHLLIKRAIKRMELEDTEKLVDAFSRQMAPEEVDIARSIYRRRVIESFKDATKRLYMSERGEKEVDYPVEEITSSE